MSMDQLLREVELRACENERNFRNCCQSTLLAVQEVLAIPVHDDLLKAGTGFSGGIGRSGSECGGYIGGIMLLGLLFGRDRATMTYPDESIRTERREKITNRLQELILRFRERFTQEYGSTKCNDIEMKIFGRSFESMNKEERDEKDRLGGHEDKCPIVLGKAARWAAELIMEEQAYRMRA